MKIATITLLTWKTLHHFIAMEEFIDKMLRNGHWSLLNYDSELKNSQSELKDEVYLESDGETDEQDPQQFPKESIGEDEVEMLDEITPPRRNQELHFKSMSPDEYGRVRIVVDPDTNSENSLKEYRIKSTKMTQKVAKNSTITAGREDGNVTKNLLAAINHLKKSHPGRDLIYTHRATGLKYRVLYGQQFIDREKLEQIIEMNSTRTDRGYILCKIHSDCRFQKPRSMKEHLFNACSNNHMRRYLFKYSCAYCLYTCSYQSMLLPHFREQHQIHFNIDAKNGNLSLIDSQKEYRLNLTDENIYTHSTSGYEYQIFYKGQAIDEESLNRILAEKSPKTESGWQICPFHDNCSYTANQAKSKRKSHFNEHAKSTSKSYLNENAKQHIVSLFFTYLCRYCFHVFSNKMNLNKHLMRHLRRWKSCN